MVVQITLWIDIFNYFEIWMIDIVYRYNKILKEQLDAVTVYAKGNWNRTTYNV